MPSDRDTVYATPRETVAAFRFDKQVADVFQDMIERSVPGYGLVLQLLGVVAEHYSQPDTNIYDLGCSLGASTLQLRRHAADGCHIVGIDNASSMVERCKANLARDHSAASAEVRLEDISKTEFTNASIVVLNFTLQFIEDAERQAILTRIVEGLTPGGVLVLAEKVNFADEDQQAFLTDLHHAFKRHQGYSDLEIAQKRAALENVLVTNSEQTHIERLQAAGLGHVYNCLRCINFSTFIGVKQ